MPFDAIASHPHWIPTSWRVLTGIHVAPAAYKQSSAKGSLIVLEEEIRSSRKKMNNSRFVASYYFPATDDVDVVLAPAIANMPAPYQEAALHHQEVLQLNQQAAFLFARKPDPAPVEAAPIQEEQVASPVYEAAPEPYVEPVYSCYAADDSSVPLYYRMANNYSAAAPKDSSTAPPTAPPTTMNMDAPLEAIQAQLNEVKLTEAPKIEGQPAETALPLVYFMQNTHLQQEVAHVQKAEVAPMQVEARVSASASKGFQKMQFANGEEASAYLFESQEDNVAVVENVVEMSSVRDEASVPAPVGPVHQVAPIAPTPYAHTGFNHHHMATGGYNNEESSYLSFQPDVTPAYGRAMTAARYSYDRPPTYTLVAPTVAAATVTQEPANQPLPTAELSVSTASVEKARFNIAIRESEDAVEPTQEEPTQQQQMDFRLIGNAFRYPVLNAPSEYQSENLNELVPMFN